MPLRNIAEPNLESALEGIEAKYSEGGLHFERHRGYSEFNALVSSGVLTPGLTIAVPSKKRYGWSDEKYTVIKRSEESMAKSPVELISGTCNFNPRKIIKSNVWYIIR